MHNPLLLAHQLNFGLVKLQAVDFKVDFIFHLLGLFLLDLAALKQLLDLVVLVHEHEVLGATQLNGFRYLRVHVLDIYVQVLLRLVDLLLRLLKNLLYEGL